MLAGDRVLSGRGLDELLGAMRTPRTQMAGGGPGKWTPRSTLRAPGGALRAPGRLRGARPRRHRSPPAWGCPSGCSSQPLRTLSGGQRRRVELARILFGGAETLLLDEPTNHLDADSIAWLRDFLRAYRGGLVVISHDVGLLEAVVNRVFYLDAQRCAMDHLQPGLEGVPGPARDRPGRRKRERATNERKAAALQAQADKMRAKATKATAAKAWSAGPSGCCRRARRGGADMVAKLRFPGPAPCGRTPLTATGLSKSYGSLEVFSDVDMAVDAGSRVVVLGLNGAGKTTLLRMLAASTIPDAGAVRPGHGLRLGYYAQEHETLDVTRTVLENMRSAAPGLDRCRAAPDPRLVPVSRRRRGQAGRVLSGGEKTRLALAILVVSGANVLLLDEPTNNLDPASREEILAALRAYRGAIVLVTHDEGAVEALQPERVVLLPDGVEDAWSDDLTELVALA